MPETTAQVRRLHPATRLQSGPAVELAATARAARRGPADGAYGPLTAAAVERAKWALGYPDVQCDRSAAPRLVDYLEGAPRRRRVPGARKGAAGAADPPRGDRREREVGDRGRAGDPLRGGAPDHALHEPRRLPLTTDCSGFVTLCYAWAGAPDPRGLGYSGQGWTGTLLANLVPSPWTQSSPATSSSSGRRREPRRARARAGGGSAALLARAGARPGRGSLQRGVGVPGAAGDLAERVWPVGGPRL